MRHLMSVAKPTLCIQCVQAPMAFAGFHGSTDESQLVQPPLAFSGRSRTHRLVEVGPAAPLLFTLTNLQRYSSSLGVSSCHLCHEQGGSDMTLPVVQASERLYLQRLRCAGDQECLCHEVQPG